MTDILASIEGRLQKQIDGKIEHAQNVFKGCVARLVVDAMPTPCLPPEVQVHVESLCLAANPYIAKRVQRNSISTIASVIGEALES